MTRPIQPRTPTEEELRTITNMSMGDMFVDPTQTDFDELFQYLSNSSIVVWDRYISDGPGYSGRVAMILWGGGPEFASHILLDADPIRLLSGELKESDDKSSWTGREIPGTSHAAGYPD